MLPACVFKVDWLVSPPVKKRRLSLQLGDANRRTQTNRRVQSVIDPAPEKKSDNTGRYYYNNVYKYIFFF